ncbi:MAG: radical SAM protein [Spirochaetales bacterium]|nr:radical SAM protein [Spirochaetales bacterium]
MMKKLSILKTVIRGNTKICELALTNVCTAKCHFCTIWKQKPKIFVNTDKCLKAITHLAKLGLRFITLTGGEPLLHPQMEQIIERCTEHNIITAILNADARLFTKKRIDALKQSGLDVACISIDHYSDKILSESRSIPGLLKHIEKAVNELKKRNFTVWALTLISNYNNRNLQELFQKCMDIGFDTIAVNYPTFSQSPVYTLGGEAIDMSREELIQALRDVIELKKEFNIVNPILSLKDIIRYLKKIPTYYECLGGYRVMFVDWNLEVYPCMYLPDSMGDALSLRPANFKKLKCNQCNMSWYRDFSIFFQGLKSIRPILTQLPVIFKRYA